MTVHVYTVGTDRNMMGSIIETEKLYDVKVNYLMPNEWYGFYTKINFTNHAQRPKKSNGRSCIALLI